MRHAPRVVSLTSVRARPTRSLLAGSGGGRHAGRAGGAERRRKALLPAQGEGAAGEETVGRRHVRHGQAQPGQSHVSCHRF